MSYIIEQFNKYYLSKIKTTKDLIYKDKVIDVYDIEGSYKKNKSFVYPELMFNNMPIYANESFSSKEMGRVFAAYEGTTKVINSFVPNKTDWVYTEVQNSLWIEGVKSSKKKIKQVMKEEFLEDPDFEDKIIKNYQMALNFIFSTNNINKENLFTLYGILSKDIDMGDNKLDGYPYRQDEVEIGPGSGIQGIAAKDIDKHMEALFSYIKLAIKSPNEDDWHISPIIAHYIFEIIHPYYDMNGRMGRLLSIWIANIKGTLKYMTLLSESINRFKKELYYKAFEVTEINKFKNDPTYFVASILTSITANNVATAIAYGYKMTLAKQNKAILSSLQIDIIKSLVSKDKEGLYQTKQFILGVDQMNPSQVSLGLKGLVENGIIKEVNSKPKMYSMNWTKRLMNEIDLLINPKELFIKKEAK